MWVRIAIARMKRVVRLGLSRSTLTVTIREFQGGEKPSAYLKCGGGCIALVVVAVTVCVVLSGFVVLKKIVYDKRPDVKQRQFEMTVNT